MSGRILAGAMSGTSADGIDVALVQIRGRGTQMTCQLLLRHHRDYPTLLRREIFSLREENSPQDSLARLARISRDVSLNYAAAVNESLVQANLHVNDLAAVAAHGQTLYHLPPHAIQALDPSLLAAEVGCQVVSDFRRADLAAGGQGAPLVPFADYILFRDPKKSRVVINIGGIANITCLPAGCDLSDVIAFDTGPGNCISDYLCRTRDASGPGYDAGGARALRGRVIDQICQEVLRDPYFALAPPKSTDTPAIIAIFQRAAQGDSHSLEDLLATACAITARTIVEQINPLEAELIVAGGGVENARIMQELNTLAKQRGWQVYRTDDFAIPIAAREAIAFALLGAATLDGVASNVPSATGARRAVVLGSVTPRP